jgi:Short C-terminal domain
MPRVPSETLYRGSPHLLVNSDVRHSLGWQVDRKAGPSFVVVRLAWSTSAKVTARFPLTEQGWASAWQELTSVDPGAAAAIAPRLAAQAARDNAAAALDALDEESLCHLRRVTFKSGSGGTPLAKDQAYELRFLADRVTVSLPRRLDPVLTIPYRDVEGVEVSGPGRVSKPLAETMTLILGLGLLGAVLGLIFLGLLGLLLGAVLSGLIGASIGSSSTRIETIARIRAAQADLYFLTTDKEPYGLRMELAPALTAIERPPGAARRDAVGSAEQPSASIPDELGKLASLLEHGTITRDEFEHLKAKLIASL